MGISDEEYKSISEKDCFCKLCNARRECELIITGVKLFLRYSDNTVRTAEGNPSVVLLAVNKVHPITVHS